VLRRARWRVVTEEPVVASRRQGVAKLSFKFLSCLTVGHVK
jgi:hypothetical protein